MPRYPFPQLTGRLDQQVIGVVLLSMGLLGLLSACNQALVTPAEPTSLRSSGATQAAPLIPTSPIPADRTPVTAVTSPGLPPSSPPTASSAPRQQPATLPDPGGYTWALVTDDLDSPVSIANAQDGSGRLFIVEQPGRVRIIQNGQVLRGAYLDIRERVGSRGNEQGLLGLAFHPRFSENGFLYVNYTDQQGDTIIARFSADPAEYRADPASEFQLLRIPQPYPNHNGGQVSFGPDGYLYLGLGDGGSAGDPQDNAQSLETLLGKILRIDVTGGTPYAIPTDNPFANGGGRPEIWAYGLRNPWRFSFDRLTGDLYIADVGQNAWEEINVMPADSPGGANFGWDYFEAVFPFEGSPPDQLRQLEPVSYYAHSEGCSVTGGVVYRGLNLPAWQGVYLYGDFCSGTIWGLLQTPGGWLNAPLFRNVGNLTTFGEDEAGEVFVADRSGAILQLVSK